MKTEQTEALAIARAYERTLEPVLATRNGERRAENYGRTVLVACNSDEPLIAKVIAANLGGLDVMVTSYPSFTGREIPKYFQFGEEVIPNYGVGSLETLNPFIIKDLTAKKGIEAVVIAPGVMTSDVSNQSDWDKLRRSFSLLKEGGVIIAPVQADKEASLKVLLDLDGFNRNSISSLRDLPNLSLVRAVR